jgi:hypothetical protein
MPKIAGVVAGGAPASEEKLAKIGTEATVATERS